MGDVDMSKKNLAFDSLEKKYRDFFAPAFKVLASGTDLLTQGIAITSVTVDTRVKGADTFEFTVVNAFDPVKKEFNWVNGLLSPGVSIEIKMGYADQLDTVFIGYITAIRYNYPSDGVPLLTVSGLDKSFPLQKGGKSFSWNDKRDSDVVKMIASRYGMKGIIDDTSIKQKVIEQRAEHDYAFIERLAKQNHFEFFVAGTSLFFRKPHKASNMKPVVTLVWGKNLRSFNKDVDISTQIAGVTVRGWDQEKKEEVKGSASSINKLSASSKTGADIMKKLFGDSAADYVFEPNISTDKQAAERADAIANERAMKLVSGSGESIGIPEIRAGKYIKLEGLGSYASQLYYIVNAKHRVSSSGYIVNFTVGGNVV